MKEKKTREKKITINLEQHKISNKLVSYERTKKRRANEKNCVVCLSFDTIALQIDWIWIFNAWISCCVVWSVNFTESWAIFSTGQQWMNSIANGIWIRSLAWKWIVRQRKRKFTVYMWLTDSPNVSECENSMWNTEEIANSWTSQRYQNVMRKNRRTKMGMKWALFSFFEFDVFVFPLFSFAVIYGLYWHMITAKRIQQIVRHLECVENDDGRSDETNNKQRQIRKHLIALQVVILLHIISSVQHIHEKIKTERGRVEKEVCSVGLLDAHFQVCDEHINILYVNAAEV